MTSRRRKKFLRNLTFLIAVSLFLTGFSLRNGFIMNYNYSTYNNVDFEEDSIFPTVIMMEKRNNNNDSSSSSLYNHHPGVEQSVGTQQQQQQQQSTVFTTTNETTTSSSSTNTTTSDSVSIEIDPNEDLSKYLERGANFLLATSGCGMATWVWNSGEHKFKDCKWRNEEQILEGHIRDIQDYDTVYIPIRYLYHFVVKKNKLDNITSKFVLLSGSFHIFQGSNRLGEGIVQRILNSTNVIAWFLHNPDTYVGRETAIKHSDKIHSFPYGLKTYRYSPNEPDPFKQFKIAFYRHLQLPPKTRDIFVSYLSTFTNELRTDMPSGPKLPLQEYYDEIAKSKFLLSPNGDRPECYRHYEAIAFGTIPITEMDPTIYPHLDEYPILYNNTKWNNLTEQDVIQLMLEQHSNKLQQIDNGATGTTTTNNNNNEKNVLKLRRHMIFEEYWMEYVEKIVGRPLRWWDKQSKQKAMLQNFTNTSYCGKNQQMIGWNKCIDNEKYFPPTNDTIVR